MDSIKRVLDNIIEWVCVVLLGIMTILVTYQVVVRYIFNKPNAYTEVLSKYMFVWLIMYGSAYVFGLREHMNIGFVRERLSDKVRIIIEMVSEIVIVLFAVGVMVYGGFGQTMSQMIQKDAALQIPMGIIYSAVPISACFMIFYFIYNEKILLKEFKEITKNAR
jgi:TRAP-type C4-dicarboxylate transport system permease small subunit